MHVCSLYQASCCTNNTNVVLSYVFVACELLLCNSFDYIVIITNTIDI